MDYDQQCALLLIFFGFILGFGIAWLVWGA